MTSVMAGESCAYALAAANQIPSCDASARFADRAKPSVRPSRAIEPADGWWNALIHGSIASGGC